MLTIRIDDQLDASLRQIAAEEGKSRSEVARELLRRHLQLKKLNAVREALQPYAETAGCVTDEDFFQEIS